MDPSLLFIIIFLLAPLLERVLKGKQQPPPPQQRPRRERPQMQRPRPEQLPRAEQEQRAEQQQRAEQADDSSAADMVPDDLWEILTGQKRERPAPAPPTRTPEPAPVEPRTEVPSAKQRRPRPGIPRKPPRPATQPERIGRMQSAPERRPATVRGEITEDEESKIAVEATREQFTVEGYVREIPVHKAPEVVSLEELVIDDEKRHASFHQRIGSSKPAEPQRPPAHQIALLLRQSDRVRQAVVLSEVLGTPRGLE